MTLPFRRSERPDVSLRVLFSGRLLPASSYILLLRMAVTSFRGNLTLRSRRVNYLGINISALASHYLYDSTSDCCNHVKTYLNVPFCRL